MTQSVKVSLLEQEQRKADNKSVGKMEKTTKGILLDSRLVYKHKERQESRKPNEKQYSLREASDIFQIQMLNLKGYQN